MKALIDSSNALGQGLAAIRAEFQIPASFPPDVLAAAQEAAQRQPTEHIDRTDIPFVTLDPASSTDLDQALWIAADGADLRLYYAIADIAWYVEDGGAIDREAWLRGETLYLPDGKARLYPPLLSENIASLLPDGPRAAIILTIRITPDGSTSLEAAERAIIRSRAKLAYDRVTAADLPPDFAALARRMDLAEARRGAARVDPPEQELQALPEGGFALAFRPLLPSETQNASLSLAANLAVAAALQAHGTGLFRVMGDPEAKAIARLRMTAQGLGLAWPDTQPLKAFEATLDAANPQHAALMLAIRRAGPGASYAPYIPGVTPWHSAMAATYCHATAPLRRLADRYVLRAILAVTNGQPVPDVVTEAFTRLPKVMAAADMRAGKIERAAIDLAESVLLHGAEGKIFAATVTDSDAKGGKVQLADLPVVARISAAGLVPGQRLQLRLEAADSVTRQLRFAVV